MDKDLCYWEIPADEPDKLVKFYAELFGWKFEKSEMFDEPYYPFTTGEKGITGGLCKRETPDQQIMNYIKVDSVADSIAKAKELGATIIKEKSVVPGHGWYAVFKDPQNNILSFWENDEKAK